MQSHSLLGALLLLTCTVQHQRSAAAAAPQAPRERVKFDFGWRHMLLRGAPPAPSYPPAMGLPNCSEPWRANASGIECSGGVPHQVPDISAEICASACCSDPLCSHWQFNTNSSDQEGSTIDEKRRCMLSPTPPGLGCKNGTPGIVGGSRPAREPPPPGPSPSSPSPYDHPEQAQQAYDDSDWQAVDVPHDMNVDQAPERLACEYGCGGRSFLARHSGWYRKRFRVPADWVGEHISVEFEGVFRHAMVYLNGHFLQNHTSGYTSFDVALPTTLLKYGSQVNVLAVYADARSGTGWWYEGGGIYRHVWLVKRSQTHLTTWGTFVAPHVHQQSIVLDNSTGSLHATATLNISAQLSSQKAASVTLTCDLLDSSGTSLTTFSSPSDVEVVAGGFLVLRATTEVPAVQLWTLRAPTLYTVRTRLLASNKTVLDEENTTIGFRSLRYTADSGFFLNEEQYKVRGFCDHNNFASVGMAVPDRVNLFRANAARSVGGNGRRMSHNPGAPSMFDIYDRVGIVVMDENREFQVGAQYNRELADMIRRDRNHPSITIWSFCNEQGCGAAPTDPVQEAGVAFRALTDELDGTRPTLGNMRSNDWGGLLTNETDVEGFSHSGRQGIDQFRARFPHKPLFESECCSCNTQRGENSCKGAGCDGSTDRRSGVQSSFNADCLAEQTNASQGVPYVVGDMVWTLFDYYGEPSYGPYDRWPHVTSTFGAFDLTGFAKPSVWWYQSNWLYRVADSSADKPFTTADSHIVRIVESWEEPSTRPLSNGTTLKPCDPELPGQQISLSGSSIKTVDGLCVDGSCTNLSTYKCNILRFVPCDASQPSQQWHYNESTRKLINAANGGCLGVPDQPYFSVDIRDEEASQEVGISPCSTGSQQQWVATLHGLRNMGRAWDQNHELNTTWCLSNGRGDSSGSVFEAVHVYSDLATVELYVNGASMGQRSIVSPAVMPTPSAQSWAEWRDVPFRAGNLTAIASNGSAVLATHTVMTSGPPAAIALSLDVPSSRTGTGDALLLDGQDMGMVRATIVDVFGRMCADATSNVSFTVVSGPGRVFGSHNGDPTCLEPNQAPWHSAYHGLVRGLIQVVKDASSPIWHRARLREIDVDSAVTEGDHPSAIVVQATAASLTPATISIPVTSDTTAGVLEVASAYAGKPVMFD